MTVRNVVIMGAGAMGASYAAMFGQAPGFNVSFLARDERLQRLRQGRLTVNSRLLHQVQAIHPDEVAGPADLLLVAVKHHHLDDILGDLKAAVGPDTIILSVMNGIDSEQTIGAAYGMDKVMPAIAVGIDAVREGESISYSKPGKIIFGQVSRESGDLRLSRLEEALTRTGIPHEISPDIMRTIWWKFMINVGVNQASAVLKAPYGVFQTDPDARMLMRLLMREVVDLAYQAGINLTEEDLDDCERVVSTLSPDGKTSMLQDIQAGRKTEVEMFAGRVVSLGQKYDYPTPVNKTILHVIKSLEKNPQPPQN